MDNLVRVGTVSFNIKLGNTMKNASSIMRIIESNKNLNRCDILVFPELCITGYSIQDMLNNRLLCENAEKSIKWLCYELYKRNIDTIISVGAPIIHNNRMYNCSVIIAYNKIIGIVPKTYIPNYTEYYEKRWFSSGCEYEIIDYAEEIKVPFGINLIFDIKRKNGNFKFGVEICEDLWAPIPPSSKLAINGAEIILNNSASPEIVGKEEYRRELVKQQSARCICGYVYCSANSTESTSDLVFSGHQIIAENGKILNEVKPLTSELARDYNYCVSDIDLDIIRHDRLVNKTFSDCVDKTDYSYVTGNGQSLIHERILRNIAIEPFVPGKNVQERCLKLFKIQVAGLEQRLRHTKSKCLVLGISGGLDSTLAFFVAYKAIMNVYGDPKNLVCITMPCFGTTTRTKANALRLAEGLGCNTLEINIEKSVKRHLLDIGLSEDDRSVAYENAQARERTQILMDVANMRKGFVVGTGDLSETALGWCTYNGDHMSMYNVNCSIPKTLIRTMVYEVGNYIVNETNMLSTDREDLVNTIRDIINTPISPELLPPNKDTISQLTEDTVGPYILNDFFLYYTLRYGFSPLKIYEYAKEACYQNLYDADDDMIRKWLKKFYERFAKAQFKRNCCPDGVKVGSVSLSPRGDWRMPSEFDISEFIEQLN